MVPRSNVCVPRHPQFDSSSLSTSLNNSVCSSCHAYSNTPPVLPFIAGAAVRDAYTCPVIPNNTAPYRGTLTCFSSPIPTTLPNLTNNLTSNITNNLTDNITNNLTNNLTGFRVRVRVLIFFFFLVAHGRCGTPCCSHS